MTRVSPAVPSESNRLRRIGWRPSRGGRPVVLTRAPEPQSAKQAVAEMHMKVGGWVGGWKWRTRKTWEVKTP